MATRTVTGRLLRPSGAPWAGGEVHFVPQDDAFTISPQQTVPVDAVTGVAASDGFFTVVLVSGLAVKYTVTLPDRQTFPVTVNDGGAVSLEQLRADTSIAPVPPQTVEDIIDAIVAGTYVEAAGDQMSGALEIAPPSGAAQVQLTATGSNHSEVLMRRAGATKWRIRLRGSDDVLAVVNEVLGTSGLEIDDANNAVTLSALAGTGSRPVVASASGALSASAVVAAIPPGLEFVTAAAFSGSSAVNVNGCFTSTYDNYRIVLSVSTASVTGALQIRMRAAGVDTVSANYDGHQVYGQFAVATVNGVAGSAATAWSLFTTYATANSDGMWTYDVIEPQLAKRTRLFGGGAVYQDGTVGYAWHSGHALRLTTPYDGFTIFPASGTITGTVRVYGYRNS